MWISVATSLYFISKANGCDLGLITGAGGLRGQSHFVFRAEVLNKTQEKNVTSVILVISSWNSPCLESVELTNPPEAEKIWYSPAQTHALA